MAHSVYSSVVPHATLAIRAAEWGHHDHRRIQKGHLHEILIARFYLLRLEPSNMLLLIKNVHKCKRRYEH